MSTDRPATDRSASWRRGVGALDAIAVTVGAMVGSGIFSTPAEVALAVPNSWAMLAVWLAGGALSLLGALTFSELGAALPEAGGLSVWLSRALGEPVGFTFSWAMLAILVPTSTGYFAQLTAASLASLAGLWGIRLGDPRALAVALIAALLTVNLLGVRAGARAQTALTVGKVALLLVLGVAGWRAPSAVVTSTVTTSLAPSASALSVALVGVLWTYDGWIDVTSVGAEVREPERTVPRALVVGTLAVVLLYLFVVGGWLHALGSAGLAGSTVPLGRLVAPWGRAGGALVLAAAALCTLGAAAVGMMTGTRVGLRVADGAPELRGLGVLSGRGVPARALCVVCGLAVLCVLSPLGQLGELFVVGAWPFYALGAVAVVVLRRREPTLRRPVRVPGYPVVPLLFAAVSSAVVLGYLLAKPRRVAFCAAVLLLGPALRAMARRWWRRSAR